MHLNKFKIVKELKRLRKTQWIKRIIGYTARDKVITQEGSIATVRGYPLRNHDLYHIEISQLERIKIGKHFVSGIHGINAPIFHNVPIVEEYESFLDEARVAFHEWLTRTSLINTLKAFLWTIWLIFNGINSFAVICRHYKTLTKQRDASNFFSHLPRGGMGESSPKKT